MPYYPLQHIHIPEEQIEFSLWFHNTLRDSIQQKVESLETELFAFQFRYQASVTGMNREEAVEEPEEISPKKSILHQTFRKLAKLLHPDRAHNAEEAQRRTELLAHASAAVDAGNLDALYEMLAQHETIQRTPLEEIFALKYQIHVLYAKQHEILSTPTWSLYELEQQWAEQGRDLLTYLAEHNT